jgi:hypothetical protein
LTFTKVFVERGGLVYSGYQNKPVVSNSARLNATGATALLAQVGLTADDPSVPLTLTAASYQGIWDLSLNGLAAGPTMTLSAAGNWSCFSDRALSTPFACTLTIDPLTGAVTETAGTGNMLGTVNFLAGTGSGTYSDPTLTPTTGTFIALRR